MNKINRKYAAIAIVAALLICNKGCLVDKIFQSKLNKFEPEIKFFGDDFASIS
jgi:hypothetical protein